MTWFAVYTEPRRELFCGDRLREAGVIVLLPFERVTRRQQLREVRGWRHRVLGHRQRPTRPEHQRVTVRDEPVFPRYLFAEGEPSVLLRAEGVVDLVRVARGGEPIAVPAHVILSIRGVTGADGLTRRRDVSRLSAHFRGAAGDRARFRPHTPLAGFEVVIKSVAGLDDTGKIWVWLETLGGRVPTEVGHADVELVAPRREAPGPLLVAA